MKTKLKKHDDGLEWLREIKQDIARECSYDPHKLGDLYRRIEKEEAEQRAQRVLALNDKPSK